MQLRVGDLKNLVSEAVIDDLVTMLIDGGWKRHGEELWSHDELTNGRLVPTDMAYDFEEEFRHSYGQALGESNWDVTKSPLFMNRELSASLLKHGWKQEHGSKWSHSKLTGLRRVSFEDAVRLDRERIEWEKKKSASAVAAPPSQREGVVVLSVDQLKTLITEESAVLREAPPGESSEQSLKFYQEQAARLSAAEKYTDQVVKALMAALKAEKDAPGGEPEMYRDQLRKAISLKNDLASIESSVRALLDMH